MWFKLEIQICDNAVNNCIYDSHEINVARSVSIHINTNNTTQKQKSSYFQFICKCIWCISRKIYNIYIYIFIYWIVIMYIGLHFTGDIYTIKDVRYVSRGISGTLWSNNILYKVCTYIIHTFNVGHKHQFHQKSCIDGKECNANSTQPPPGCLCYSWRTFTVF